MEVWVETEAGVVQRTHRSGEAARLEQFEGEVEPVVEGAPLLVESDGHGQRLAGRQTLPVPGRQLKLVLAHVLLVRPVKHTDSGRLHDPNQTRQGVVGAHKNVLSSPHDLYKTIFYKLMSV